MSKLALIPSCGEPGCADCKGAFVSVLVACESSSYYCEHRCKHGPCPDCELKDPIYCSDPAFAALSARLAEMNWHVHSMKPRSRERSLYAMTIYGAIDDARAKPLYTNPKFAAYERAGARA